MSQVLRLLSAAAGPLCRAAGARARLAAARLSAAGCRSFSVSNVSRTPLDRLCADRLQSAQRRFYSSEPKGEAFRSCRRCS
ncbi:hypothetical protein EYF80_053785 [Liparis tanakae]|uniref:Uncharacterized protein n=1 Tax=Liparis tanakae TaxID=230148 RepID=A0A4Z2F6G2_9TELE|nr:hypothetical protein EYF80_053785 [Liparis tanakae]